VAKELRNGLLPFLRNFPGTAQDGMAGGKLIPELWSTGNLCKVFRVEPKRVDDGLLRSEAARFYLGRTYGRR